MLEQTADGKMEKSKNRTKDVKLGRKISFSQDIYFQSHNGMI